MNLLESFISVLSSTWNTLSTGLLDLQHNQDLFLHNAGAEPTFNNLGTFRKSIATGITRFNSPC